MWRRGRLGWRGWGGGGGGPGSFGTGGGGEAVTCDAVVMVASGRRAATNVSDLRGPNAVDAVRRAWPMPELHRSREQLPAHLGSACRCYQLQLSRRPEDAVAALNGLSRTI